MIIGCVTLVPVKPEWSKDFRQVASIIATREGESSYRVVGGRKVKNSLKRRLKESSLKKLDSR
jgi:hypothetical protein